MEQLLKVEQHVFYFAYDLPNYIKLIGDLAIDTETTGLKIKRDRLCLVQIMDSTSNVYLVHFPTPYYECPNLKKILLDDTKNKIFHFARFDLGFLQYHLNINIKNIFCTKLASRLVRTYTEQHSLKDICLDLLNIKLIKEQQCSYWGKDNLSKEQENYAITDVKYLHALKAVLVSMLKRENRLEIAEDCFNFIPQRAKLDILGWTDDIFAHRSSFKRS